MPICRGHNKNVNITFFSNLDRYDLDVAPGKDGDKGDNKRYEENDDDNANDEEVENGTCDYMRL